MKKQEIVRNKMVEAMKNRDKERKDALSMLLAALQKAEIDRRHILSESEENGVVQKEIKQLKETLELCPSNRNDIKAQCELRIAVYEEFCPKMMDESEIETVIHEVFADLQLENPTTKEKGKIMSKLMPLVKGKADGKLVDQVLMKILK